MGGTQGCAKRGRSLSTNTREPIVEVEHLVKHFPVKQGVFARGHGIVHAVEDVTLAVHPGETLGIVGESGCGKSTTARLMLRLLDPTSGTIRFEGRDITRLSQRELRPLRRQMQIVFQDPYSSLNPRKTVEQIVGAPFVIHDVARGREIRTRVQALLEVVGLSPEHISRYPHEFSGGQRQRIGVARALALNPRLIVCDEPVSALDVSVQAQILTLLRNLQSEFDLTYVFISHDLSVIRQVADRIAVMYLGRVVEIGTADELFDRPRHPYTAVLMSAVPRMTEAGVQRRRISVGGDVPSPISPPACLRLPPAVPPLPAGPLRCRDAGARCVRRAHTRRRLPLPARTLADERGGDPDARCHNGGGVARSSGGRPGASSSPDSFDCQSSSISRVCSSIRNRTKVDANRRARGSMSPRPCRTPCSTRVRTRRHTCIRSTGSRVKRGSDRISPTVGDFPRSSDLTPQEASERGRYALRGRC